MSEIVSSGSRLAISSTKSPPPVGAASSTIRSRVGADAVLDARDLARRERRRHEPAQLRVARRVHRQERLRRLEHLGRRVAELHALARAERLRVARDRADVLVADDRPVVHRGPGRAARGCPPAARGGRSARRGAGARSSSSRSSAGWPQKSSEPRSASGEPVLCETATTRLYRATPVSSVSHVERVASSAWSVAVPRVGKRSVRLFCCAPTPTVQRTSAPLWGASWMRSIARFGGWAAERRSPSPRARFDSRSRPRWSPEPEPIRRGAGLWPCPPATVPAGLRCHRSGDGHRPRRPGRRVGRR